MLVLLFNLKKNLRFFLTIYLREHVQKCKREKESQADTVLSAEPDMPGLDLTTLRSQSEPKPRVDGLTMPPRHPYSL